MKKNILPLLSLLLAFSTAVSAQCVDTLNIYTFVYNGHTYEMVKENKGWVDASACAVSRNGYLAEIDDVAEQNAIFTELTTNAGINLANTPNQFGTASVWIGGSDAGIEGKWIWDGDNDGIGPQFWDGGPAGSPTGGLYTNWGTSPAEPDNSGGQDHLTIIIKPTAVNFGKWNDLKSNNSIYYLIEINSNLSSNNGDEILQHISVYPNPINDVLTISNSSSIQIDQIEIYSIDGHRVKTINTDEIMNNDIDVSRLKTGLYILKFYFDGGMTGSLKVSK